MKSDYKQLGQYISQVDVRNKDLSIQNLLGVSIEKKFIPSIANIVGTDLSNYKIVSKGQFAYGPVTSRNGEKISIAYLDGNDCIISSSYTVFEVVNRDELYPEYLMLWFNRPEFDRYARYKSHGSVREIFDWDELCAVELPIPDIEKQKNIVRIYKAINDRIELKKRIIDNLAEYLNCVYVKLTQKLEETIPLSSICRYVTEKITFSDVDSPIYISTENILPDKQGVSSFGTTSLSERVTPFQAEDVLVSNIRPYFKKMWFATTNGGCNADVLCFRCIDKRYSFLLKSIMYQDSFYDYVMSGAKGTKMPRGDKQHIMQYQTPCFSEQKLQQFNALALSIERTQAQNRKEISSLELVKSMLLTTLSR